MRAATDIINSLSTEPWRWKLSCYTYRRDDGVEVWRDNMPILNICLYSPVEMGFPLFDKFRLWRAFRRWRREMPLTGYREATHDR